MSRWGIDGRTAQVRGDPVVWLGLACSAGALATVAPVTTAMASAVLLILLARKGGRGARALVVLSTLALVIGFLRGRAALSHHEWERARVSAEQRPWPARCVVDGVVSRSPALASGGLRVEVRAATLRCRDGPAFVVSKVLLYAPASLHDAPAVARGDEVSATASLAPPYRFWNDGAGDPRPISARRGVILSGSADDLIVVRRGSGVAQWVDRVRALLRARIVVTFPAETEAMARALVLGEDDLSGDDSRAFRKSGLAHLLAVSGMHLVLVVMGIVAAVRAVLVRIPSLAGRVDVARFAAAFGLPIAWVYADLAGGSGSAVRAAWMCSVALSARVLGRRAMTWRALGLSLVAMSILDPLVAFDVSFLLSAFATIGILALARPLEHAVCERAPFLPRIVRVPLSTTLAATLSCAPVLALIAPELPLGGLLANVIAVPLGEAAALPLCLAHGALAVWPAAEKGCATAASGALTLVRIVARGFTWGALPVPSPTALQLGAIAIAAGGIALGRPRRWALAGLLSFLGLEGIERWRGSPHGTLRVTFLDVGQGDAALVDFPDGSAMLVDGGGLVGSPIDVGERAVLPLLAARRRDALDIAVLSHPHPDHFLGLASSFARVTPHTFWDTGQGELEGMTGPYGSMLSDLRRRGVPLRRPPELCGTHGIGGARVDVLAPCPELGADRGANDNSFVLRLRFGGRAVLLVGDAEHAEEAELVQRWGADGKLHADVLKVGHHGSRTSSSPAFLRAVSPSVAVISCGVRNRFGHPHEATLGALLGSGARVLRTDLDGSVIVTTDGTSLEVRTMHARDGL